MAISTNVFSFTPTYVETEKYKVKTSKQYANQNNPRYCKFETRYNNSKEVIELRAGVVGSPVDYFGWNMELKMNEFPLVEGFRKEFKTPGVTTMVLTYEKGILKFFKHKESKVWNRLYPFSIVIDSELTSPKAFKAVMEGYETTPFGLKKHVKEQCHF